MADAPYVGEPVYNGRRGERVYVEREGGFYPIGEVTDVRLVYDASGTRSRAEGYAVTAITHPTMTRALLLAVTP